MIISLCVLPGRLWSAALIVLSRHWRVLGVFLPGASGFLPKRGGNLGSWIKKSAIYSAFCAGGDAGGLADRAGNHGKAPEEKTKTSDYSRGREVGEKSGSSVLQGVLVPHPERAQRRFRSGATGRTGTFNEIKSDISREMVRKTFLLVKKYVVGLY